VDESATDPASSWSDTVMAVRLLLAAALLALAGPTATSGPTVGGVLQQGRQLVATPGTWTGSGDVSYAYQWYRCDPHGAHCSSIHGATGATYTQVARDVGGTLGFTVTATDASGSTPAYAPLAGIVAPAKATPLAAAQPTVTGTPTVGQVVTVGTVKWSPAASSSYAWERCNANGRLCAPIAGATAQTYTVAADDVGSTLLAAVTAGTTTVLSLPTTVARPASGPTLRTRPSVTGALQVGHQIEAHFGTWLGNGQITYAFQWYRCDENAAHCHSIRGATGQWYTEVVRDAGTTLGLAVRATDASGTATAYAPVTGLVAAGSAPVAATSQPTLLGKAVVGQTLTAKPGTWFGGPAPRLAWSWLRCNVNGRACGGIAGAAGVRYVLTAADGGHTIVAAARATTGSIVLSVASLVVTQ
jgi:hypothetical protein